MDTLELVQRLFDADHYLQNNPDAVQSGLDEKQIERERQHEADPVVARGKVAHDVFCFAAA